MHVHCLIINSRRVHGEGYGTWFMCNTVYDLDQKVSCTIIIIVSSSVHKVLQLHFALAVSCSCSLTSLGSIIYISLLQLYMYNYMKIT